MKKNLKHLVWLVFAALAFLNIYIFISGISIAEKIDDFEKSIKKFHQENIDLEKQVYDSNSLQNAASEAAKNEFVKKAEPVYLDNLKYAFNK